MNAHVYEGTEITTGRRKPSEIVAEYDAKREDLTEALATFEAAGTALKTACTIGGTWGTVNVNVGGPYPSTAADALLKSAWRHVYQLYGLADIATAQDKRRIEAMFEKPPAFTVANIRDQFGAYVMDPWGSILRGLAEVFSDLDPAFKSHEKMKIGAKGLPKRVIISNWGGCGSWGRDKVRDILNALAAYQGKPLLTHAELCALEADGEALRDGGKCPDPFQNRWERENKPKTVPVIGRGVWLKTFGNGNAHLFFDPEALRDVNKALAEFYGEVLTDCYDEDEARPARRTGTDVAKDLQYYPTPLAVVERVLGNMPWLDGMEVLEPSCGCGRILDALSARKAEVYGIEVDPARAALARVKGHPVLCANFLDVSPSQFSRQVDFVVMNPPFYGKHYAKHVRHALKFVRPGGQVVAILPITARYDHGLLDDLDPRWSDLPVGSFAESGTNVNTTVATIRVEKGAAA